jgi:hypothetical protein
MRLTYIQEFAGNLTLSQLTYIRRKRDKLFLVLVPKAAVSLSSSNILLKIVIYSGRPLLISNLKKYHYLIFPFLGKVKIGIIAFH